jgi:hypothetical protein
VPIAPTGLRPPPHRFDAATAARFADVALANIGRAYPHKLDHVIAGEADVVAPRDLHPAFHGSFDWHSCVHMHWLLARIRRAFPHLPACAPIDAVFDRHLSPAVIASELAYLNRRSSATFERPYGWAWLLKLAAELANGDDDHRVRWSRNLRPLADAFASRFIEFLPRSRYPVRHGVHGNTAFALALAIDYARAVDNRVLGAACIEKASEFFAADRDLPARWEPSGADFLSCVLTEATLMGRVLGRHAFDPWLAAALPGFAAALPATLFTPVVVDDRSDGQLVHLDGLNLSRAGCFYEIAAGLARDDSRADVARRAADLHLAAGWHGLASDEFVGAHWLASFAVLALDAAC